MNCYNCGRETCSSTALIIQAPWSPRQPAKDRSNHTGTLIAVACSNLLGVQLDFMLACHKDLDAHGFSMFTNRHQSVRTAQVRDSAACSTLRLRLQPRNSQSPKSQSLTRHLKGGAIESCAVSLTRGRKSSAGRENLNFPRSPMPRFEVRGCQLCAKRT